MSTTTPATNTNGQTVHAFDQVTIQGLCTGVTGTNKGVGITVQVTTIMGDTVSVQAGDCKCVDNGANTSRLGRTTDTGNFFGSIDAYDDVVTINGVVQSITNGPWGSTGQLVVKTDFSGTVITVSSGSVVSHG